MPRRGPEFGYVSESPVTYNPLTPCPVPKHLSLLYCNTPCIPLVVGVREDRFEVHQNRLFAVSGWFKSALESGFKETSSQIISFPTEDLTVIEIFVQWLYTAEPTFSDISDEAFTQLVKLYEFATRLHIRELKNYIVWKLFDLRRQDLIPPMSTISYAFENLPNQAIFRHILVAWFTWDQKSGEALTVGFLSANPEFSAELVLSMVKKQKGVRDILATSAHNHYENEDGRVKS